MDPRRQQWDHLLSSVTSEGTASTGLHFIPLQIQDARNHVNQAIYLLTNRDVNYQFKTGSEVLKVSRTLYGRWDKRAESLNSTYLSF